MTRSVSFLAVVVLALPHGTTAQTVEGDVYVVTPNGDVKPVAGNVVRLVQDSDSLRLRQASVCREYRREVAPLERLTGTAAGAEDVHYRMRRLMHRTVGEISAMLKAATVLEASTGMRAHYVFASVEPGRYFLWAEASIEDRSYQWWTPVSVLPGTSLRKDLDNSALARLQLYCGIK